MSDVKKNYTKEELDRMSNAELAALGTELDDVTVCLLYTSDAADDCCRV